MPNNDSIAISANPTLFNVNMTNVTKLNETNFLMWSRQVHALLDGYDLAGYIDGTLAPPSPTITVNNFVTPNPEYNFWKRQDRLVYSALLGAISSSIQPILSNTTHSAQIWTQLTSTYAKPSRGHIKQIKQQLKTWTKGAKSVTEYVQGFVTWFDQLALLGKPLDHEDQVEYLLEGLPEDYKTIVDQIESRDTAPTLTKIHEKLLNHEVKLQFIIASSASTPVTTNVATTRTNSSNSSRGNYRSNQQAGGRFNRSHSYS